MNLVEFAMHTSPAALSSLMEALLSAPIPVSQPDLDPPRSAEELAAAAMESAVLDVLFVLDVPYDADQDGPGEGTTASCHGAAGAGPAAADCSVAPASGFGFGGGGGCKPEGSPGGRRRGLIPLSAFLRQASEAAGGAALVGRSVRLLAFPAARTVATTQLGGQARGQGQGGGDGASDGGAVGGTRAGGGGSGEAAANDGGAGGGVGKASGDKDSGKEGMFRGKLVAYEPEQGAFRVEYDPGQPLKLWQVEGLDYSRLHLAACHVELDPPPPAQQSARYNEAAATVPVVAPEADRAVTAATACVGPEAAGSAEAAAVPEEAEAVQGGLQALQLSDGHDGPAGPGHDRTPAAGRPPGLEGPFWGCMQAIPESWLQCILDRLYQRVAGRPARHVDGGEGDRPSTAPEPHAQHPPADTREPDVPSRLPVRDTSADQDQDQAMAPDGAGVPPPTAPGPEAVSLEVDLRPPRAAGPGPAPAAAAPAGPTELAPGVGEAAAAGGAPPLTDVGVAGMAASQAVETAAAGEAEAEGAAAAAMETETERGGAVPGVGIGRAAEGLEVDTERDRQMALAEGGNAAVGPSPATPSSLPVSGDAAVEQAQAESSKAPVIVTAEGPAGPLPPGAAPTRGSPEEAPGTASQSPNGEEDAAAAGAADRPYVGPHASRPAAGAELTAETDLMGTAAEATPAAANEATPAAAALGEASLAEAPGGTRGEMVQLPAESSAGAGAIVGVPLDGVAAVAVAETAEVGTAEAEAAEMEMEMEAEAVLTEMEVDTAVVAAEAEARPGAHTHVPAKAPPAAPAALQEEVPEEAPTEPAAEGTPAVAERQEASGLQPQEPPPEYYHSGAPTDCAGTALVSAIPPSEVQEDLVPEHIASAPASTAGVYEALVAPAADQAAAPAFVPELEPEPEAQAAWATDPAEDVDPKFAEDLCVGLFVMAMSSRHRGMRLEERARHLFMWALQDPDYVSSEIRKLEEKRQLAQAGMG